MTAQHAETRTPDQVELERLTRIIALQKAAQAKSGSPDYDVRHDRLGRLLRLITENEKALCEAMNKPELVSDERFCTHTARGGNMEALDGIVNDWCNKKAVAEVVALMEKHAVPAGKIYRAPDMLSDPQFIARDSIVDMPTEQWPNLKMQNVFPKMSKTQGEIRWPGVETLGAHNEEVYKELLGLDEEEIKELAAKSII